MKRLTLLGLLLSLGSIAGCHSTTTSPGNVSVIVTAVSEVFAGTLDVQGSSSFNFIVGNADPLRVTLASVTDVSTGAAITTNIKLGLGSPSGDTCATTFTTTTTAALVAQYLQVVSPGSYCIVVSDPGTMTKSVNFAVRIVHS